MYRHTSSLYSLTAHGSEQMRFCENELRVFKPKKAIETQRENDLLFLLAGCCYFLSRIGWHRRVRLVCLIFKWFTLFSCFHVSFSRQARTFLVPPTSSLLTTDKLLYIFASL